MRRRHQGRRGWSSGRSRLCPLLSQAVQPLRAEESGGQGWVQRSLSLLLLLLLRLHLNAVATDCALTTVGQALEATGRLVGRVPHAALVHIAGAPRQALCILDLGHTGTRVRLVEAVKGDELAVARAGGDPMVVLGESTPECSPSAIAVAAQGRIE